MSTTGTWIGLKLEPLDTLFFRDGRPFDAATRASGGLPQPQTLAGAIRTALLARSGFNFNEFAKKRKANPDQLRESLTQAGANDAIIDAAFRGPWLARVNSDNALSPLMTMPETLKRGKEEGTWSIAEPKDKIKVPGWSDPNLHPLWREIDADPKADPELLTYSAIQKFLNGKLSDISKEEVFETKSLFTADHRVGIVVNPDKFTTEEGMLYAISLLAMRPKFSKQNQVCLYAEIQVDAETAKSLTDAPIPFGGEGKYVTVEILKKPCFETTEKPLGSAMWYMATPTFLKHENGKSLPEIASLKAAASGAGVPVSGWDVARNGPRATRFAVPAGAVYFTDGDVEADNFLDFDLETASLRQEGWGFALPGKWEGI